eukprot:scaffold930_cov408-Prasinococcus_capsulatus_cf.AAC.7
MPAPLPPTSSPERPRGLPRAPSQPPSLPPSGLLPLGIVVLITLGGHREGAWRAPHCCAASGPAQGTRPGVPCRGSVSQTLERARVVAGDSTMNEPLCGVWR